MTTLLEGHFPLFMYLSEKTWIVEGRKSEISWPVVVEINEVTFVSCSDCWQFATEKRNG